MSLEGLLGPESSCGPVTLVLLCVPCSLSPRHLREELQLLLQLSERRDLRPCDGGLPLPSGCQWSPL